MADLGEEDHMGTESFLPHHVKARALSGSDHWVPSRFGSHFIFIKTLQSWHAVSHFPDTRTKAGKVERCCVGASLLGRALLQDCQAASLFVIWFAFNFDYNYHLCGQPCCVLLGYFLRVCP